MKQAANTSKGKKAAISSRQLNRERTLGVLALLRDLAAWLGLSQTKKEDPPASSSRSKPGVSVAKKQRVISPKGTKRIKNG